MKLNELISELKKYEDEFGECEVVTYFDLPWHNPPRKQGSKIMIMDGSGESPKKTITWENGI